jgi:hypothetical protein
VPLTETDIKAIRPKSTGHRWLNDGAGLYLRVAPSDRRTWIWRTKRNGKTSYFTIGEWPDLTVKAARAALARRTGRATPANALTVKDALEEWFSDQIELKYRVSNAPRTYVNRSIAEFGARRLQELTRAEIARFVRGYAKETPVAANRTHGHLPLYSPGAVVGFIVAELTRERMTNRAAVRRAAHAQVPCDLQRGGDAA